MDVHAHIRVHAHNHVHVHTHVDAYAHTHGHVYLQELLSLSFSPKELKRGFFEAWEMHEAGFDVVALKDLGYTPKDL